MDPHIEKFLTAILVGAAMFGYILAQAAGCSMQWADEWMRDQGWLLDHARSVLM